MIQKKSQANPYRSKVLFQTERLTARELYPGDAQNLYSLNSDPEVIRYTGDRPFASVQEAALFLEGYREYEIHGFGRWAIELKDSGAFIGWCGLKRHDEDWVDLGFRFQRSQWGQGYATEAAKACLKIGFTRFDLKAIISRAAVANKASLRVLENIEMRFWKWGSIEGIPFAAYYRMESADYFGKFPQ